MARTLTPATSAQVTSVRIALDHLRTARDHLANAESPNALAKVQTAIKSTDGALRHVQRRRDAHGLALASHGFNCAACGRPELECSEDPCADVQADREALAPTPLETAARALLAAFGGDVPDWLRTEADALSAALAA